MRHPLALDELGLMPCRASNRAAFLLQWRTQTDRTEAIRELGLSIAGGLARKKACRHSRSGKTPCWLAALPLFARLVDSALGRSDALSIRLPSLSRLPSGPALVGNRRSRCRVPVKQGRPPCEGTHELI